MYTQCVYGTHPRADAELLGGEEQLVEERGHVQHHLYSRHGFVGEMGVYGKVIRQLCVCFYIHTEVRHSEDERREKERNIHTKTLASRVYMSRAGQ